ncbi:hypothetical protein [Nonomuraea basaltis]|uniref:hypothetical protein n=1 Tax=Nonomuraea basaltis TaxID=2495887 RepID=UPI00110C44D4|nr:hypothetical protein [Nonomuraea basaltis]TMR90497.1 hypothetical protein EJK15_54930 [Nonomuraea basaltis]
MIIPRAFRNQRHSGATTGTQWHTPNVGGRPLPQVGCEWWLVQSGLGRSRTRKGTGYLFRRFLRSDAAWNVERGLGYRSEEFDTLIDRAAAETDPARRRELYGRVQRLLAADRPMIPLAYQDNPVVTTAQVGGVVQNAAYVVDLGKLTPSG